MAMGSLLVRRAAFLLAALSVIAVVAVLHSATASAVNPTLTGDFCTFNGSMFCMTMTWNGVAYGTPDRSRVLSLKPGTYDLTGNDNSPAHDFVLRSCPGSKVVCDKNNALAGTPTVVTTRAAITPSTVTVTLTDGTYRLYCDVGTHEANGMFVDFAVGFPVATNSAGTTAASVAYGGSLSHALTVSATDPDTLGSALTASATGLPAGLSLSVDTTSDDSTLPGTRTWDVSGSVSASPGTYPVTATVSDADAQTGTTSFSIVVTKAPLTVTADHTSRLFGASNPPLTATLSGFVLGQSLATSDVAGTASCTTTAVPFSPLGDYPITCAVGTLSSTNYSFGPFVANTLSVTSSSPCVTGTHNGGLKVGAGEAICVAPGAHVTGGIKVDPGGALDLEGATVSGGVKVSGATVVRICGSSLSGQLSVSGDTDLVLVGGDAATGPCAGNSISGGADLSDNQGGVEFNGNRVSGGLSISGTGGTLPPPDTGPVQATGNSVTGRTRITP
jgi:hypothetical protein